MYLQHFGLRERPFELTPNPQFMFVTERHREALSAIRYGLMARRGITVLTGEAGTGKTTVLEVALRGQFPVAIHQAWIANPTLSRTEFIEAIARGFGLDPAGNKVTLLSRIEACVRQSNAAGAVAALVVDEAQSLPTELLEEVRLLANIETHERKLLQVILAGQPELEARLQRPELLQFRQRIAVRCSLGALSLAQTVGFVSGRLRIAGGEPTAIFSADAVRAIYERSGGVPRSRARWRASARARQGAISATGSRSRPRRSRRTGRLTCPASRPR
jgi:general secretion pathway protein A